MSHLNLKVICLQVIRPRDTLHQAPQHQSLYLTKEVIQETRSSSPADRIRFAIIISAIKDSFRLNIYYHNVFLYRINSIRSIAGFSLAHNDISKRRISTMLFPWQCALCEPKVEKQNLMRLHTFATTSNLWKSPCTISFNGSCRLPKTSHVSSLAGSRFLIFRKWHQAISSNVNVVWRPLLNNCQWHCQMMGNVLNWV